LGFVRGEFCAILLVWSLLDGAIVEGALRLDVINPATGKVFDTITRTNANQLEQAGGAAKASASGWAALGCAAICSLFDLGSD
jgi:acyl-CoA reductase-like NAD-dependent aldehyde dehydrogenase